MRTFQRPVGFDADDVVASQASLINAGGRNPYVAAAVANRQVAARRRGHAITIDAFHRVHDFVTRMLQIALSSGHVPGLPSPLTPLPQRGEGNRCAGWISLVVIFVTVVFVSVSGFQASRFAPIRSIYA